MKFDLSVQSWQLLALDKEYENMWITTILPCVFVNCADLALYVWMSSINHGVQCLVSVFSLSDLLNVFEVFLPQLLLYPNASDPLNGDAASLMMKDKKLYDEKVKEYCERYAKKEHISKSKAEEESDEDDISEEECGSSDDDIPGHADP
ncbi:hypothetical protein Ahy_A01g001886 isoform C [Arachis hypogaea]|uniref:Uncharacterized protein n=1 Tax=Arachis hypogaea TaxID=3818 RepID=A0A445EPP7_ARAHY|nr:hypothetical protein Ahy_A01g001886 isoform C [Arachis hypogaea]